MKKLLLFLALPLLVIGQVKTGSVGKANTYNITNNPDNTTITVNGSNQILVKDSSITSAKIATGAVGTSEIADGTVSNTDLAGSIADSKLNQITASEKVAGSAVQLNVTGGLSNSTGLKVNLDTDDLEVSSNNVRLKDASIDWDELKTAVKDSVRQYSAGSLTITNNPDDVTIVETGGEIKLKDNLKELTDLSDTPDYIGQTATKNGIIYRANSLTNYIKWTAPADFAWPFLPNNAGTSVSWGYDSLMNAVKDLYLQGTRVSGKYYYIRVIRNSGGNWYINIYSNDADGLSPVLVAQYTTASSPEVGDSVLVHTLSESGSSGITGKCAINWSELTVGTDYYAYGYSATGGKYFLSTKIWDTDARGIINNIENTDNIAPTLTRSSITTLNETPLGINEIRVKKGIEYKANSTSNYIKWAAPHDIAYPWKSNNPGSASTPLPGYDSLMYAVKDFYVVGTPGASKYYYLRIQRNVAANWYVILYESALNGTSQVIVARYNVTSSPEDGNKTTVHTLAEVGGSGFTAKIAINWTEISEGVDYFAYGHDGAAGGYYLSDDIWDIEKSPLLNNKWSSYTDETQTVTNGYKFTMADGIPYIEESGTTPAFIKYGSAAYDVKVGFGMLGNPEANMFYNFDYENSVHQVYDTTKNAYSITLVDYGLVLQYIPKNYSNTPTSPDIWGRTGNQNLIRIDSSGYTAVRGFRNYIKTITASYTLLPADHTILCNAASGAITVTLPSASSSATSMNSANNKSGTEYVIKKIDSSANAITIDGNGAETIDGATTKTLSTQWNYYKIQSNGSAWYITGNN